MRSRLLATCLLGGVLAAPVAASPGPAAGVGPDRPVAGRATPSDGPVVAPVTARLRIPRVTATVVARVTGGTALAFRAGDPTPYLARQQGQVVALVRGTPTILDLADRVGTHREQGLLGVTFAPSGRHLYVYFTAPTNENVLEEYRVRGPSPVTVDAASRRTLLVVPHVKPTHNGGQIAFGPDGLLYVGIGDGGGHRGTGPGQVPGGNSQSLDNLLGKILRIDPTPSGDQPYTVPASNPFAAGGGAPEILHYGLRNPWRFSFDRATGDLWIGDVGQDHWEEIDLVPHGTPAPVNFGYPLLEGSHPLAADAAPGTARPVHELWHRAGNCAVTGGYVYRGRAIAALRGRYVFADYCKGDLKVLEVRDGHLVGLGRLGLKVPLVSSFGEDHDGEIYVVSQARGVLRVEPGRRQGEASDPARSAARREE